MKHTYEVIVGNIGSVYCGTNGFVACVYLNDNFIETVDYRTHVYTDGKLRRAYGSIIERFSAFVRL